MESIRVKYRIENPDVFWISYRPFRCIASSVDGAVHLRGARNGLSWRARLGVVLKRPLGYGVNPCGISYTQLFYIFGYGIQVTAGGVWSLLVLDIMSTVLVCHAVS